MARRHLATKHREVVAPARHGAGFGLRVQCLGNGGAQKSRFWSFLLDSAKYEWLSIANLVAGPAYSPRYLVDPPTSGMHDERSERPPSRCCWRRRDSGDSAGKLNRYGIPQR